MPRLNSPNSQSALEYHAPKLRDGVGDGAIPSPLAEETGTARRARLPWRAPERSPRFRSGGSSSSPRPLARAQKTETRPALHMVAHGASF